MLKMEVPAPNSTTKKRATSKVILKAGLHQFPESVFGSTSDLIQTRETQERDTLMIACSEQGTAPDNISFSTPDRFVILQHIGASMPSTVDCERYEGLSCDYVERLFQKYGFRHVIVCGHLDCGVIRNWLRPPMEGYSDIGHFRARFETGTRDLVDTNYSPQTAADRYTLMICEHVLCQIENLLTHSFIWDRVHSGQTSFHGWVVDDETARVLAFNSAESAFIPM